MNKYIGKCNDIVVVILSTNYIRRVFAGYLYSIAAGNQRTFVKQQHILMLTIVLTSIFSLFLIVAAVIFHECVVDYSFRGL